MQNEPLKEYKLELKDLKKNRQDIFKPINCPSCGSSVPAVNININDKVGKCDNCNVLFSIEQDVADLNSEVKLKQEVIRPEGIDIFYFDEELDLSIQQPISPFEVFLFTHNLMFGILILVMRMSFPIPLWVAAPLFMLSLYGLFNLLFRSHHKIFIGIDKKHLSIVRRPRKFIKDKIFDIKDIDQLYVKSKGTKGQLFMIVNGDDGQKHIKLTPFLSSKSKARYLEQEMERYLDIEDREIPEES